MIYALSQIQKLKGRTVLLDTNILLFVYGAGREDSERVRSYSRGMAALMGQGIETVVTPTILSEFYNQSLRQDYAFHQNEYSTFKLFRNADIGRKCTEAVCVSIRRILASSKFVMDPSMTSDSILSLLQGGKLDFGDSLSILTARRYDYIIFTDDIDFKDTGVSILTNNSKYLKRSSKR